MQDRVRAIVATNAFGMGVDKPDIRSVIHYGLPAPLRRTTRRPDARARRQTVRAVLLYAPDDQDLQEWFIDHDAPDLIELQRLVGQLEDLASPAARCALPWPNWRRRSRCTTSPRVWRSASWRRPVRCGACRMWRTDAIAAPPAARAVDLVAIHDETERRRDYKRTKLARSCTMRKRPPAGGGSSSAISGIRGDRTPRAAATCAWPARASGGPACTAPAGPRRARADDDGLGDMLDPVDAWLRGNRRRRRQPRLDTVEHTLVLFDQGLSPAAIARARDLSERTVWGHLATLVGRGEVHVDRLVPHDVQVHIREAATRIGGGRLAPIKACCRVSRTNRSVA